jgi:hypothetical protein
MTTSASTSWELTRNEFIEAALRKLGVLPEGVAATATQFTTGAQALNGIIARFNTLGMPLWKRSEATITLVDGVSTYTLSAALKLAEVYIRVINSSVTWKLELKSEYDIRSLPYSSTGTPNCYSYTPNLLEGGTLRVWPIPDASSATEYNLLTIFQKELYNVTGSTETIDFPSYWTDAVIFELASVLAPEYGIPLNDRMALKLQAKEYLDQAVGYSDEDGSFYIQPYSRNT